jgi:thiol-disulfide isomerase/thioredoxin
MDAQGVESKSYLTEFYGKECPHCASMEPLVTRLQDEEGVEIRKYEVWHSEQNATLMREYDQGRCGGVPFFYNPQTGKWLCGVVSYEKLKEWGLGK